MEKQRGIKFGISRKLLIYFLILSLVPLIIIGSTSFVVTKNQLEENAEEYLLVLARDCGRKISYYVDSRYQDIKLLSKADVFQGTDTDAMQKYVTAVKEVYPYYVAVSIIDQNGTITACTNEELVGESRSDKEWFQRAIQCKEDDLIVTDPYRAETADWKMLIGFNSPITDESNKEVIGVLTTRVAMDHIVQRIQALDERTLGDNHAYLLSSRGEILAGPDESDFLTTHRLYNYSVVQDLLDGKTGITEYENDRGEKVISGRYALSGEGDFDGWGWGIIVTEPVSEALMAAYVIRNVLVALLLVISVLVTVLAIFVSRRFSRPITQVSESALRIARGDLKATEIKYGPKDEIGELVSAFNEMREKLDVTTVSRDLLIKEMDERKRAEEERERLYQELEAKSKELEQMVYVASHDLRSPLVNVQGFSKELDQSVKELSSALQREDIPTAIKEEVIPILDEDIPEALQYIHTSTSKMDSLLSGLLRLSRLGRAALTIEKLDMNTLMSDIAGAFEFQIKDKDAELVIGSLPPCRGDKMQINQVFSNLLDNALKYLDPNRPGVIKITGQEDKRQSIYCIEDNGVGIAPEHQAKIFEIFQQLDPGTTTGEGLGLTIVWQILDRHNGRIWLESEPGKGSKFFVALPTYKK